MINLFILKREIRVQGYEIVPRAYDRKGKILHKHSSNRRISAIRSSVSGILVRRVVPFSRSLDLDPTFCSVTFHVPPRTLFHRR